MNERFEKDNSEPAPDRPHRGTGARPSNDSIGRQLSDADGMPDQQW